MHKDDGGKNITKPDNDNPREIRKSLNEIEDLKPNEQGSNDSFTQGHGQQEQKPSGKKK